LLDALKIPMKAMTETNSKTLAFGIYLTGVWGRRTGREETKKNLDLFGSCTVSTHLSSCVTIASAASGNL
jgi:hypothetical protein